MSGAKCANQPSEAEFPGDPSRSKGARPPTPSSGWIEGFCPAVLGWGGVPLFFRGEQSQPGGVFGSNCCEWKLAQRPCIREPLCGVEEPHERVPSPCIRDYRSPELPPTIHTQTQAVFSSRGWLPARRVELVFVWDEEVLRLLNSQPDTFLSSRWSFSVTVRVA